MTARGSATHYNDDLTSALPGDEEMRFEALFHDIFNRTGFCAPNTNRS